MFVDYVGGRISGLSVLPGRLFALKFVSVKIFFKAVANLAVLIPGNRVRRTHVVNVLSCFNFSNPRHHIRGMARARTDLTANS